MISFISNAPISLNRNEKRIFRILLPAGSFTMNFDVEFGDIDVAVFDDFTNAAAPRCGLSANNGPVDETITLPGSCTSGRYQVEVRAAVNSRFTITAGTDVSAAAITEDASPKVLLAEFDQPTVAGPPALQAAIGDDENQAVYLPLVTR